MSVVLIQLQILKAGDCFKPTGAHLHHFADEFGGKGECSGHPKQSADIRCGEQVCAAEDAEQLCVSLLRRAGHELWSPVEILHQNCTIPLAVGGGKPCRGFQPSQRHTSREIQPERVPGQLVKVRHRLGEEQHRYPQDGSKFGIACQNFIPGHG